MHTFIFLLVSLTLTGAAPLTEPTVVDLVDGAHVVLEIKQWKFVSTPTGAIDFTTRAWCYNNQCSVPGPTLKFYPGTTATVEVKNTIPTGQQSPTNTNSYHSPDTFNIHTHGLHVSPYQDDVHTQVLPQTSRNYTYTIPSYHYEGTHWYHTHYHGNTNYGVSGGLAGMIDMQRPSSVTGVSAAWDAMRSSMLALTPFNMNTACARRRRRQMRRILGGGKPPGGGGGAFTEVTYCAQYLMMQPQSSNIPTWDSATTRQILLVNGQENPSLTVAPGEWYRLRLLNMGGTFWLSIQLTGCTMLLLGWDGVFFDAPRTETVFTMNQGKRADVAFQCATAGTYNMATVVRGFNALLEYPAENFLTITVTGSAVSMTQPATPPPKPSYLADTRSLTLATTKTWSLRGGQIDNALFAGPTSYSFNFTIGSPVQWVVDSGFHPYHQHVHHFQLQADVVDGANTIARAGDWADVLSAPMYTMRFWAVTFDGVLTIHCHFLDHEDKGMMTVVGMDAPPGTPSPSTTPTTSPSKTPTSNPSTSPTTSAPSGSPTMTPSAAPTFSRSPTTTPSVGPSSSPSTTPSKSPTPVPQPSKTPSSSPTHVPTVNGTTTTSAQTTRTRGPTVSSRGHMPWAISIGVALVLCLIHCV